MQALSEQLLFTTTRIEGNTANGVSIGTGFFFDYKERLFLITNKHVVKNVVSGYFSMVRSCVSNGIEEPIIGSKVSIRFTESNFIGHPDQNIDVTVMNTSNLINQMVATGNPLYRKSVSEALIPTASDYDKFISPIEDVVFVGYPNGLFDTKNNLPIIRRGVTASPCYYNFDGNKIFLIDASVFPGSSGSPVLFIMPEHIQINPEKPI
ncbi:MAG: serine protease [Acidobacteriota bacterium]|nr:serine protease [Acidobacteriota bacterium]